VADAPCIWVLAGTNGAGKSSIAGEIVRSHSADYFNPDEAAQRIGAANPGLPQTEANSAAWHEGRRLLERAIAEGLDFTFETTLGGNTIPALLERAAGHGHEIRVFYVGLASPELHLRRVRARVEKGGHDIPEALLRKRFDASRRNLIHLLPWLAELRVFDNSIEADPATGRAPHPVLVLHLAGGRIVDVNALAGTPAWAQPIAAAAMKLAVTA
jgi:predicted ABC-type ATPase